MTGTKNRWATITFCPAGWYTFGSQANTRQNTQKRKRPHGWLAGLMIVKAARTHCYIRAHLRESCELCREMMVHRPGHFCANVNLPPTGRRAAHSLPAQAEDSPPRQRPSSPVTPRGYHRRSRLSIRAKAFIDRHLRCYHLCLFLQNLRAFDRCLASWGGIHVSSISSLKDSRRCS